MNTISAKWLPAHVERQRKGKTFSNCEILDFRTHPAVRYRYEPLHRIALKCAGLFAVWIPIYFALYTSFQLIRLPFASGTLRQLKRILWTPYYFVALEIASLYGIFKPLEGRALIGALEKEMHSRPYKCDYRYVEGLSYRKLIWQALTEKEPPYTFFAAVCMQPLGVVTDEKIYLL